MLEVQEAPVSSQETGAKAGRFFVRFTRAQRTMHAVLFSTFLGLAATGLPLRFSPPARHTRASRVLNWPSRTRSQVAAHPHSGAGRAIF